MSRSGYNDDCNGWELIRWRGAVQSALNGSRGQAFLKEMLAALDEMPVRRLITDDLVRDGEACAIGSVAVARKIDVSGIDPYDRTTIAKTFDIAEALAAEIAFINDDDFSYNTETPEDRWQRVRKWVAQHIR